jgi:hypothetical protein
MTLSIPTLVAVIEDATHLEGLFTPPSVSQTPLDNLVRKAAQHVANQLGPDGDRDVLEHWTRVLVMSVITSFVDRDIASFIDHSPASFIDAERELNKWDITFEDEECHRVRLTYIEDYGS